MPGSSSTGYLQKLSYPLLMNLNRYSRFQARSDNFAVLEEHRNFTVGVAQGKIDRFMVYCLRKAVFGSEYGLGKKLTLIERDRYDRWAHHLVVREKKSGRVIACYRMIFGDKPADFYSSTEFDLASVFSLPGKKLELSRACIHPDFRNGVVLSLLWRGLGRFAALNQVRFLIGIPSVRTEDPDLAEAFFQYFKARGLTSDFAVVDPIKPLVPRLANVGHAEGSTVTPEVLEAELPSLMKLYFKAGARICGRACHDPAFKCIDFFTILDFKDLAESFRKRYYT